MVWEIVMFIVCFIAGLMLFNVRTIIDVAADVISDAIDQSSPDRAKAAASVCSSCGTSRRKPGQRFCPRCGMRLTSPKKT